MGRNWYCWASQVWARRLALRHLALETARQGNEIPIYIELKYYEGGELETLLARCVNDILLARKLALAPNFAESTQMIKKWLAQSDSRFLLLLDGLNEVRSEYHTSVRGALDALFNHPQRIVISCREREYDGSLNDRATAFVLRGLQENEIRNYLESTFGAKGTKLFNEQIRQDRKMLTFAANPFMLYLIGEVARRDRQVRLPKNRGKLIQEFVALMPRLRMSERTHSKIASDVVETALASLGFGMQKREQRSADLREVRRWNVPTAKKDLEDVLAQAKDWRLLESDGQLGERIEFLHQLFLEYFAAVHLNNEFQKNENCEIVLDDLRLSDWWESIEMLAGICDSPVELIQSIALSSIKNNDPLAAILAHNCWRSNDDVLKGKARENVVDALITALCHPLSHMFLLDTLICLSETRDTRLIPLMISLMRFLDGLVINEIVEDPLCGWASQPLSRLLPRWMVGLFGRAGFSIHVLGKLRDRRAIKPLIKSLNDPKPQIRLKAVVALGRIGGTQAIKPLVGALGDQDEFVRDSAAFALIRIGKSAVPLLRGALRHANLNVRMNAAFALRKIGYRLGRRGLNLASRKEKQKNLEFLSKFSDIDQLEKKAASKYTR